MKGKQLQEKEGKKKKKKKKYAKKKKKKKKRKKERKEKKSRGKLINDVYRWKMSIILDFYKILDNL